MGGVGLSFETQSTLQHVWNLVDGVRSVTRNVHDETKSDVALWLSVMIRVK